MIDVQKEVLSGEELSEMYQAFEMVMEHTQQGSSFRKKYGWYGSAAAILVGILAGYAWLSQRQTIHQGDIVEIAKVFKIDSIAENVSLSVSEKKEIQIEEDNAHIEYSKEGHIQINTQKEVIRENKQEDYNQLWVPKGKRSTLLLSDGTKLWLNAQTRVIYPNRFSGSSREIYVDGEIYLEVTKNTEMPFIVKASQIDVQVVGTAFNIKARENEHSATVVLVEGAVSVNTQGQTTLLSPNHLLSLKDGRIKVEETDTEYHILWKTGTYKFKSESLSKVLRTFSEYYGIRIECSPEIDALVCSGKLNLKDNIEQVLNGLSKMMDLEWDHQDDKYMLRKKTK